MRCQDLRVVQLEQLRRSVRTAERTALGPVLQDMDRKEVRELAQAAGLQTRQKDSNKSWVAVAELRAALLEHLLPEPPAAPEDIAFGFGLFLVILLLMMCLAGCLDRRCAAQHDQETACFGPCHCNACESEGW